MKPDTSLDRVVFHLIPTRERCEVLAVAGDETDKVADGLIEPFLMHIEEANVQFQMGKDALKLETTASDAATWFTRGTLERFVRLVTDPEVLEDVCNTHAELLQLEEAPRCMRAEDTSDAATTSNSVSRDVEANNAEFNLKEPEAYREALYSKQSEAFSRATAAGFSVETMPSLIRFCTAFGVNRRLDLCNRYVKICMKIRTMEIWLGEMVARAEEQLSRDTMEEQETSSAAGDLATSSTGVCNGGSANEGPQDDADRRLSVQEKIIMFENKKDTEKRRLSAADAGKTDAHKPVLRRWTLAVEKIVASSAEAANEKNITEVDEEVFDKSQQTQSVGSPKPSRGDGNQDEHKCDDQTSVLSDTEDTKGRLYEQYQEKRDAKLKEESVSLKAERQARLRSMQESLERRRAESLKSKKADPLAEAKLRAEKLRAFKAELKKIKEEDERKRMEDIRLQRLQRKLTAPSSPRSGASTPRQQTVRGKATMKGPLPTFQRVSFVGTNAVNSTTRKRSDVRAPAAAAELKQGNGIPRGLLGQDKADKADVTAKGKTLNKKEAGYNRSRNMVRKSAPVLVNRRGGQVRVSGQADGLKSIGLIEAAEVEDIKEIVAVEENGSSVERIAIRAPVTATEDEFEKLVGDENDGETKLVDGDENGGENVSSDERVALVVV